MNMTNWDLLTETMRQEEIARQAQKDRLAHDYLVETGAPLNPALAWLGHRLAEVGAALVKLSGERDEHAAENSAKWN